VDNRLKPQDVLVALKLARRSEHWKFAEIADELSMSVSEVHGAVKRLVACDLFNEALRRVDRASLRNFLVHGLRHVFPASPAERVRGMPTAMSAPPLRGALIAGEDDRVVWPSPRADGVLGRRIDPIYRSAPEAAAKDLELYELLALTDALRTGRARERNLASRELERRLA
jgi:hypothetical protein